MSGEDDALAPRPHWHRAWAVGLRWMSARSIHLRVLIETIGPTAHFRATLAGCKDSVGTMRIAWLHGAHPHGLAKDHVELDSLVLC